MKKIFLSIVLFLLSVVWFVFATPPSFNHSSNGLSHVWYKITEVSKNMSLKDNIMNLFFPSATRSGWIIWEKLRVIFVWLLFIFLVRAGFLFLFDADNEWELKKAKLNIMYIMYWAFLIFASVWLLWTILNVWGDSIWAGKTIVNVQKSILWSILIFFKSLAYYVAVLMVVYYGFRIMQAQEKDDKIKTARTGIVNVILALIAIKVLDYVYYIAQTGNLKWKMSTLFAWAGKALGWFLWVVLVMAVLYAAVLLITSRWNEEAWKKSKIIIRNVFLVVFIIFLFIVIVYDLIKNFAS